VLKPLFGLVVCCILALSSLTLAAPTPVTVAIEFDQSGLSSLKLGDTQLLVSAQPRLTRLSPDPGNKAFDAQSDQYDARTHKRTLVYSWGKIVVIYKPAKDRIDFDCTISNDSAAPIKELRLGLVQIQFPSTPAGYDWEHRYGIWDQSPDDLPVLMADWGSARLALCNEKSDSFVKFGFDPIQTGPYAITLWLDDRPIPAGSALSATLSARFGGAGSPSGASAWSIAGDVLAKFAARYPSELNWSDRRPIGSAFLATSVAGYKNNPRGWFMDRDLDTTTPAGREAFHAELMKYTDQVIAHCKLMNAQGVIVWDVEGQEMPHATSYLADPRMLSKVAPEMDSIADEFFKKLTDAGLRTGLTIRPTRVEPLPDGKPGWTQVEVPNPVAEMDAKMTYATKRWGCSIYYCDSNVNFVRDPNAKILNDPAMPASDFQALARLHKQCLLIPEHKNARYFAYTAPYYELRLGFTGTAPEIKATYPHAFSVIRVVDGPDLVGTVADQMISAIQGGDILLFRPWWDDPTTAQIKALYNRAATQPVASQQ
jgi:hypothetical protein